MSNGMTGFSDNFEAGKVRKNGRKPGTGRILPGLLATLILAAPPLSQARAAELKILEEKKGGKIYTEGWVDEAGSLVNGPVGYAYTVYERGTDGTVTEKYYTAEGEPFETAGGYYGKTVKYGNKNRIDEVIYLGENGDRAANAAGFSRMRVRYMSTGDVTFVYYYGAGNKQETVPELGYAQIENTYRGTTLTGRTYLDGKQKPVDISTGYAAMIQRVNRSNQILEIRYEHADGSAASCRDGWSSCERELDKEGRILSAVYLDEAGNQVNNSGGYSREIREYLADGSFTVRRQDSAGNDVAMSGEYDMVRREIDGEGRVKREIFLTAAGEQAFDGNLAGARAYEYDEAGRICSVTLEDGNGNSVSGKDGWAGYRDSFDERGLVSRRVFVGVDGNPVNTAAGYSEIQYEYDAAGRKTAETGVDINGNAVPLN